MSEGRTRGTVKWFDMGKGFGFIGRPDGEDVFVHITEVQRSGLNALYEGQQVAFDLQETQRGHQAVNLEILEVEPPRPAIPITEREEPLRLSEIYYAAALSFFENEHLDPTQCELWPGTRLADVDPGFRVKMDIVGPFEGESWDEYFERKFSILEALARVAGHERSIEALRSYLETARTRKK